MLRKGLNQCVKGLRPTSLLAQRQQQRPRLTWPSRSQATVAAAVRPRGVDREPLALRVGQTLHGYTCERIEEIPERNMTAVVLTHKASGARHLHLDTADTNNVFAVAFRTVPKDDMGIAHVLEHTALCGSEKYPVRDPFFHMLKRSVNTYMNAWTGPDFTAYPFSSVTAFSVLSFCSLSVYIFL